MASPVRTYQTEMHTNLGFFATWLPGDPIDIGDVGTMVDGRFRRLSSLAEIDVVCEASDPGPAQSVQYTSARGTKVETKAAADLVGVANAEVAINFSTEGAFVFHASGLRARQLKNLPVIERGVLKAYEKGKWQKDWFIIDAVQESSCTTIIVSQDTAASLVLTAKLAGGLAALSLADPKLGLRVSASSGKLLHVVGGRSLKPLYSCLRVQSRLFGPASLKPVLGGTDHSSGFERASLGDLVEH